MPSVRVFCPCSEKVPLVIRDAADLELSALPTTITQAYTLHPLSTLNFCEHCQAVKCRKCLELEVVTKFCPSCMHEMKPEYSFCSRNCFDCPLCGSNIVVSQAKSDEEGKRFNLKCAMCEFHYVTPLLDKPRSLARVVRSEVNTLAPVEMFSDLEKHYIQSRQFQEGQLVDIRKALIKQCKEMKIKDAEIPDFIRRSTIKKFDMTSDMDGAKRRASIKSSEELIHYDHASRHTVPQLDKSKPVYPISTKLRAKHSKRCKACRTSLMKPDQDPASVKFYKLSNAIDYLPTITAHPHPTISNDYLLVFKNPLDREMTITLSTTTSSPFNCTVHLPITNFTLGAKPENTKPDALVKTIPSIELTRATKLGRIELMTRKPVNYEAKDVIYEKLKNFCVLPLKRMVPPTTPLGSPLAAAVLVSIHSGDIAFGFWTVVDLGSFE